MGAYYNGKKILSKVSKLVYDWENILPYIIELHIPATENPLTDKFSNQKHIERIVVADGITEIAKGAFSGNTSLESISIPFVGQKLDGTGGTYFSFIFGANSYVDTPNYLPPALTEVKITGGSKIGDNAFRNCTSLTSIEIPDSVTSIGANAFYTCSSLKSIEIPDSVTSIGSNIFQNCYSLTEATIGNGVTSITWGMFLNCKALTSVALSNSITSIAGAGFRGCSSLASIEIPDSVTSIGENAFYYCSSLKVVNFSSSTSIPTLASSNAFSGVPSTCQLVIPDSLYDSWIVATNWSALNITYVKASEYTGG